MFIHIVIASMLSVSAQRTDPVGAIHKQIHRSIEIYLPAPPVAPDPVFYYNELIKMDFDSKSKIKRIQASDGSDPWFMDGILRMVEKKRIKTAIIEDIAGKNNIKNCSIIFPVIIASTGYSDRHLTQKPQPVNFYKFNNKNTSGYVIFGDPIESINSYYWQYKKDTMKMQQEKAKTKPPSSERNDWGDAGSVLKTYNLLQQKHYRSPGKADDITCRSIYTGARYRGDIRQLAAAIKEKYNSRVHRILGDSILTLQGIVATNGTLSSIKIQNGTPSPFADFIIQTLEKDATLWSPALQGGTPVKSYVKIAIRLNNNGSLTILAPHSR